jgi:geranylgeranyl diphosphate synthase type I
MVRQDDRALIQQAMREAFPRPEARVERFYGMQEYQLGWRDESLQPANEDPGKLVRPRLALMACRAVGGDSQRALPLAAAIQLVHDFSLIHDDIEDNSDTRRGRPTVWKIWGLAQGINAGDGLLIVAHLALHNLATTGVPPMIALEALRRFDQTILEVCEGQFLDLSFEGNLDVSEADYLTMIERKTAVLIAAAASLGALVGGADPESVQGMRAFGLNLGLSFQVQDDVLGIWGNPAQTGKPFAADLFRRKLSLPVIHALRSAEQRDTLADFYRQPPSDHDNVEPILAILDAAGSQAYTEQIAAEYHRRTLAALDQVQGDATALAELRAIATSLLGRKS